MCRLWIYKNISHCYYNCIYALLRACDKKQDAKYIYLITAMCVQRNTIRIILIRKYFNIRYCWWYKMLRYINKSLKNFLAKKCLWIYIYRCLINRFRKVRILMANIFINFRNNSDFQISLFIVYFYRKKSQQSCINEIEYSFSLILILPIIKFKWYNISM